MGHGTHTDSRILYGDWSSIEITNPVSGFAPAGGCESLFGLLSEIGNQLAVSRVCRCIVLPFYRFTPSCFYHTSTCTYPRLVLLHCCTWND